MPTIGYARVSTLEQDTALQLDAMARASVDRVVEEKRSGVARRPALEALLAGLSAGDVLVVYKVDRLARSLTDLMRIVDHVEACGASFRSLTEPIDTSSPLGRMMFQILGSFAEFERSTIRQRCEAGRISARERGVRFGRPRRVDLARLQQYLSEGKRVTEISEIFGVHYTSVYHAISDLRSGRLSV